MKKNISTDIPFFIVIGFLVLFGIVILFSTFPSLFPLYFFYIFLSLLVFILLLFVDFEILSVFSRFFYVGSIIFLIMPILIGQVTRGTIRWIPLGKLSIQPAEIVRPFLLIFFANYLYKQKLNLGGILKMIGLFFIPLVLILFQPSLGVALLTGIGFLGLLLASNIEKKYLFYIIGTGLIILPLGWMILKPYQRQRLITFVNPVEDPYGAGYNVIQSTISVGSGKLFGRGLGRGIQTQLSFLPEKHTDFIFASLSEEMGFLGAFLVILTEGFLLFKLASLVSLAASPQARCYLTGFFLILFSQNFIHIGMNMGLLPVTGIPLPLVSSGGSSLLGTMIGLAVAIKSQKRLV